MKKVARFFGGLGIAAACLVLGTISTKAATDVAITEQNFPDQEFRRIVSAVCDIDKNGILSAAEINATTKLTIGARNIDEYEEIEKLMPEIKNLKGVEYFTELTDLWIGYRDSFEKRTPIDASAVDLSKNTKLTSLTLIANVDRLDLSSNIQLTKLEISSQRLKTLDITALKNLEKLYFINCSRLTDLDLYTVKEVTGTGYRMGHDDVNLPGSFYGCDRLSSITFEGNAPRFGENSFSEPILVATIFYPKGNKTWNKVKGKNYGGLITWKAYNLNDGKLSDEQDSDALPALPAKAKIGNNSTEGYFKVLSDGKSLAFVKPITDEGTDSEEVTIRKSVKIGGHNYPVRSIGKDAFKGYNKLRRIYISAELKKVDNNAFRKLNRKNKVMIYIMTKNKKVYKSVKKVLGKKVPKNVKFKWYRY